MYLIDTKYCSKIIDKNSALIQYLTDKLTNSTYVATSVISKGELVFGVEKSSLKNENTIKLNNFLSDIDILLIDIDVADFYGQLKNAVVSKYGPKKVRKEISVEKIGVSDNDLWIAAVAIKNDLIIISEDDDFDRIKGADNRVRYEIWPISS